MHQSECVKLSVIVPVYRTERYLEEIVRSLKAQTFTDFEVVLVDDGSPDGSPALCDRIAAEDKRFRVIHKLNEGLGYARNTGLEAARGEYVTFIDSDDTISPATFADALAILDDTGADMVRYTCNRFTDSGQSTPESYDGAPQLFDSEADIRAIALCIFDIPTPAHERYDMGGSSCMAIYRRDIIERHHIRFESERQYMSEDYLFSFDFYMHARRVVWLPRTYYHYRVTPGSLTQRLNLNVMDRVETYSRHVTEVLTEAGMGSQALHYATGFYIRALRANMRHVFMSKTLSMAEKRRWFHERVSDPVFRARCEDYDIDSLPFKQRTLLRAMLAGRFATCYLIITLFSRLRRDKLK